MITGMYINTICTFLLFRLLKVLHILTKKGLGAIRFYNMTYTTTKY